MILKKLEGTIITNTEEVEIYRDYLESHRSLFKLNTFKYLNTPICDLPMYGHSSSEGLSIIEAFTNFLVVGKLNDIAKNYYNLKKSRYDETENLLTMFESKGYKVRKLVKSLIDVYIDSFLDKVIYIINKGGLVEVTSMYNTSTYKRSK